MKILIVDDEPRIRETLGARLRAKAAGKNYVLISETGSLAMALE